MNLVTLLDSPTCRSPNARDPRSTNAIHLSSVAGSRSSSWVSLDRGAELVGPSTEAGCPIGKTERINFLWGT